jgi:uncharacterized membrane protein
MGTRCFEFEQTCAKDGDPVAGDGTEFGATLVGDVTMEETFGELASAIALGIECVAVIIVAIGSVEALLGVAGALMSPQSHGRKKDVWRRFGTWLLLGLEFELAADIVRSVIAPTWLDIGQLGAIAVIRTFLNYFLEKDLDHAESSAETGHARLEHSTAGTLPSRVGM